MYDVALKAMYFGAESTEELATLPKSRTAAMPTVAVGAAVCSIVTVYQPAVPETTQSTSVKPHEGASERMLPESPSLQVQAS